MVCGLNNGDDCLCLNVSLPTYHPIRVGGEAADPLPELWASAFLNKEGEREKRFDEMLNKSSQSQNELLLRAAVSPGI